MPDFAHLFRPILAGVTLKDRLFACGGAFAGIAITALIGLALTGLGGAWPYLVAPMGASAVLVFILPASPLAQPWPVVFGNTASALVGIAVARLVHQPALAAALATSLAIVIMSFTRSLHPPGGAAALTAVLGGAAVKDMGFAFAFLPVALNSLALVAAGVAFHKLLGHTYPHRPQAPAPSTHATKDKPPVERSGIAVADVSAAVADLHETLDIDPKDIEAVVRLAEQHALTRTHGTLRCVDIMSRDVITISVAEGARKARELLMHRKLRLLPVTTADNVLVGTVGLRQLTELADDAEIPVIPAVTATAEVAAISLLPSLTDGIHHGAVIVDEAHRVVGVVSQTDLLAALGRLLIMASS